MNNDDLIPKIPRFENPMGDLLARLNSQEALNQDMGQLLQEMTGLLRGVVETQAAHSEQIAKIAQHLESQQRT